MSFQDLEAGPARGASQAVASGIFRINTAVATFQRLVNTLGTPKDTPDLRDRM
jgi:syntaxin 7